MDVHFSMQLLDGVMGAALAEGLHKKFKLGSKLAISALQMLGLLFQVDT